MSNYELDAQRDHSDRSRPRAVPSAAPLPPMLQLQAAAGNAAVAGLLEQQERAAGDQVRQVLSSGGRPLDDSVRADAESHLGADLGHVRVHDDAAAAASAHAVQAQAYTSGSHVVFGDGKYDTVSSEGRHRLAHELTHVVQQQAGPVDGSRTTGGLSISDPGDRFEQAADLAAASFVQRLPVQREAAPEDEDELQMQREPVPEDEDELQMQRQHQGDERDDVAAEA